MYIVSTYTFNIKIYACDTIKVEKGHKSSTEILNDFCDGKAFSSHPLFSMKANSLQIMLYFDELETCNALGSKAKIHKLGTYTL